jgi:hypothetical protein
LPVSGERPPPTDKPPAGNGVATMPRQKPPKFLSEQLRELLRASDADSLSEVGRQTGIAVSTLSRFLHGKRTLSQSAWDKLGAFLDLELRPVWRGPTISLSGR